MKRLSISPIAVAIGLGLLSVFVTATSAQERVPPTPSSSPPSTAAPDGPLVVLGQITNGTPGGSLPITTSILLHGFDGQTQAVMTAGEADASGRFHFENVANKPGRAFGVTATVGRTTFFSDLQFPQPGSAELTLPLKTYDATTDASQVAIEQMFILGEFLNEQELRVTNGYILSNHGDRSVEDSETAADGRTAALRFTLPGEATDVQFQREGAERFIRTDDGFLTTWGIPPGDNVSEVTVRYTLPYSGQLQLESRVQYPVQVVNVQFADQGVALSSPHLEEQGTIPRQDGAPLLAYKGGALAAGQLLAIDLSGAPQVALADAGDVRTDDGGDAAAQASEPDNRRRLALGVVASGVALLAASGVWWYLAARRGQLAGVLPEHNALVQALACLDEAREAEAISHADYTRQRQILKAALRSALEDPLGCAEANSNETAGVEQAHTS